MKLAIVSSIVLLASMTWLALHHNNSADTSSDTTTHSLIAPYLARRRVTHNTTRQRRNKATKVRPVKFYAMGDAPYSHQEKKNLAKQLELLDPTVDFVVHLGDMQDRMRTCIPSEYTELADTLVTKSPVRTFIVPGDNCYYDCVNWRDGWEYWKNSFHHMDGNWTSKFNVRKQSSRKENFAITVQRVLFIGIHTLWSRNIKDEKEWQRLERHNVQWTKTQLRNFAEAGTVDAVVILSHSYTRKALYPKYWEFLSEKADELDMPMLFLQGDAHKFRQDTPFGSDNILRTIVDRGGIADPVLVTVDLTKENPFRFEHRPLTGN